MNGFNSMTSREKLSVSICVIFTLATIFWLMVYEPAVEKRRILLRKIDKKQEELIEVTAIADRVVELKKEFDQFEKRIAKNRSETSILSRIETVANETGARENVTSMSPSPPVTTDKYRESVIQIKIEKISLDGLVRFLSELKESGRGSRVKQLSVKTEFDDPSLLKVTVAVAFIEPLK